MAWTFVTDTVLSLPLALDERQRIASAAALGVAVLGGFYQGYRYFLKSEWPDEIHSDGSRIPVFPGGSRWTQTQDQGRSPADATDFHYRVRDFVRSKKVSVVKVLSTLGDQYWVHKLEDANYMLENCPNKPHIYQTFRKTFFGYDSLFTMTSISDQKRRQQRKVIARAFSNVTIKSFLGDIDKVLEDLFKKFDEYAAKDEAFNIGDMMVHTTTDVTGRIMFGNKSMNALMGGSKSRGHQVLTDIQTTLMERTRKVQMRPWLYWFRWFVKGQREADRAAERLYACYKEMLDDYKGNKTAKDFENDMSVMGRILALDMGERDTITTMNMSFVGGIDTTAYAMSFCLHDVSTHPEVQAKLVRDFKQHGLESPFCKNVLRESMRWKPVSTFIGFRAPTTDLTLPSGVTVPKGATVGAFGAACFQDERLDRPTEFIPERWDEGHPDKKLLKFVKPFSTGPRACLGVQLARIEMDHIIPKILSNFEMKPVEGGWDWVFFTFRPFGRMIKVARRPVSATSSSAAMGC